MVEELIEVHDDMRIHWDAAIEMDDGVVLRADVFRPIPEGRYAVILAMGPFAKGLHFGEGFPTHYERLIREHPDVLDGSSGKYQNFEHVDPEKWVPDGYVCVRVDSRGTGQSPGHLCLYQHRETLDLARCIEWAASQPWSNGRVGLSGISYLGMNQWYVASLNPPPTGLTAMIPWEAAADFYRDATYHGGILSTFWENLDQRIVRRVQHGVGDRGFINPVNRRPVAGWANLSESQLAQNRCEFAEEIRKHPFDDAFHRERAPVWENVRVPFLSAGNWGGQGLHLRGNVEAYVQAASAEKWLELHGLEHWTHFYTDYGVTLQKEFFDHYLQGRDNGWSNRGRVLMQVRNVDGFAYREEDGWPLPRTQWTSFHLDPSSLTLSPKQVNETSTVAYDGFGEGVTFYSSPLDQETEITGHVAVRLHVASSTQDADLFAVLRVFDAEGQEVVFQGHTDPHTPVGQGWLRCSHRELDPGKSLEYRPYHKHEGRSVLEPGTVYAVEVEVWPTCIVVPKGYRVALTLRGTDYEYEGEDETDRGVYATYPQPLRGSGPFLHHDPENRPDDMFSGTVTIFGGGDFDSRLVLPIIPSAT